MLAYSCRHGATLALIWSPVCFWSLEMKKLKHLALSLAANCVGLLLACVTDQDNRLSLAEWPHAVLKMLFAREFNFFSFSFCGRAVRSHFFCCCFKTTPITSAERCDAVLMWSSRFALWTMKLRQTSISMRWTVPLRGRDRIHNQPEWARRVFPKLKTD